MSELWDVEDLAKFLRVPVNTIYAWRKKKYGPTGRKIGKHVRYRPADVHAWVASQTDGAE
jgi:predicted DNA-binding transcriptional regulator AlpA